MFYRKAWLAVFVALLVAGQSGIAEAQNTEPVRMLEWRCWLETDRQFSIYCVEVGFDELLDADYPVARARTGAARGVAGNDVASLARKNPAEIDGRVWLIPLYNLPFDMDRVKLLARSVMCGRDSMCMVQLDTAPRR